jgi:hypothetical protein
MLRAKPSIKILSLGAQLAIQSSGEFDGALSHLQTGGDFRTYDPDLGKFINFLADAELQSLHSFPHTRRE